MPESILNNPGGLSLKSSKKQSSKKQSSKPCCIKPKSSSKSSSRSSSRLSIKSSKPKSKLKTHDKNRTLKLPKKGKVRQGKLKDPPLRKINPDDAIYEEHTINPESSESSESSVKIKKKKSKRATKKTNKMSTSIKFALIATLLGRINPEIAEIKEVDKYKALSTKMTHASIAQHMNFYYAVHNAEERTGKEMTPEEIKEVYETFVKQKNQFFYRDQNKQYNKQYQNKQKIPKQKHKFKGRKKKTKKKDKGGKKSSESCDKLDKHDCISMWPHCKYMNGYCVDSDKSEGKYESEYERRIKRVSASDKKKELEKKKKLLDKQLDKMVKVQGPLAPGRPSLIRQKSTQGSPKESSLYIDSINIKLLNDKIMKEVSERKSKLSKEKINKWKKATKDERKNAKTKFIKSNDALFKKYNREYKKYKDDKTENLLKKLIEVSSVNLL